MAGESKGDNKLFQMMMVVITTIVAPVTVYFITHALGSASGAAAVPTSTLPAQVNGAAVTATADLPLITPTAALPPTSPAQPQPTTPVGESGQPGIQNPQGILPAGAEGVVDGIAISMVKENMQVKDGAASIQLRVRNQSGVVQTLRYQVQSIAVKDANGRSLDVIFGEKRGACSKKDLSTERKIELAPDQEIILQSVEVEQDSNWCASVDTRLLPRYQASTREAPDAIVIQFNGFGPFQGFGFQIDL